MTRKSYYKPYKRSYRSKAHWASNLKQGGLDQSAGVVLVENASQSSVPTPIIVKAGNFKIQGDLAVSDYSGGGTAYPTVFVFLLYAPEGIANSSSALISSLQAHPEWVMGWTAVDCPSVASNGTSAGNKFSISTRLKRNLNSGDRIILFTQVSIGISVNVQYTAQFFTRAN